MSERVHVVLVATTHPGNIGASARAMKTMGLGSLRLVRPSGFPGAEASARAAGAGDLLAAAGIFDTLAEAVRDCSLVLGSSARQRSIPWPEFTPREAAARAAAAAAAGEDVALVFGQERSGLSNEELALCNGMIRIPANPAFHSLNLAAAVQIVAYEMRLAFLPETVPEAGEARLASAAAMEQFYEHLARCLEDIGFYDPERPRRLMQRLRRLFNRAQLDENEYNILRGILAAAQDLARRR
jgi:tRNA (cytidine32/uridine32-2'-O)-methyltransferase